jgi:hypothetical protein
MRSNKKRSFQLRYTVRLRWEAEIQLKVEAKHCELAGKASDFRRATGHLRAMVRFCGRCDAAVRGLRYPGARAAPDRDGHRPTRHPAQPIFSWRRQRAQCGARERPVDQHGQLRHFAISCSRHRLFQTGQQGDRMKYRIQNGLHSMVCHPSDGAQASGGNVPNDAERLVLAGAILDAEHQDSGVIGSDKRDTSRHCCCHAGRP